MSRRLRVSVLLGLAALVLVVVASGTPSADAAEKYTRGLRYASLTPDGKEVVFAYRGDIWVKSADGASPARRLTIHEAQDTLPRVSPDGKLVAFSSTREGSYDLYVMPITGGEAKRISFHSGLEIMCDWSPDGKRILFASNRDPSLFRIDLYEMPAEGGAVRRITRDGGRDGTYSADGKTIVYCRGFNTIYQDDYEGSANYDIYTVPAAGGTPTRLTDTPGNERHPFFSADGKEIWFVAEEKGVANFYGMPVEGGKRRPITQFKGNDVQRPCLGWDRKTVVYERWGQLYVSDLTQSPAEGRLLPLLVKGDRRHSGRERRTVTSGAQQIDVSRDGSRMVFSMHGDIWMTSGSGGNARRLTSGPDKDEWPRFSPEGSRIAFQSDRSGNSDIWLLELANGKTTQLTKDKAGDFFHSWAPDGSKLVFCSERSGNRDIWSIEVASGATSQLTKHSAGDDDPVYSPDGRHIAFDSAREGNQAIYVMDAEGGNVRRVTSGGGFLQVPNWSPDGSLIVYESFNPANGSSGGLYVIGASGGPSMQISREGSAACWSSRGDYIYFSVGDRGREEIYRVPAPKTVENREKVPFLGTVEVDLREELGQLFDEAWVALGQGFYDAKMHGVDWKKMREKYRDMAIDAENKDEFQNVVRQMLAELNASHLGIYGGSRTGNAVEARAEPTGYLGVELADGEGDDGGRKIASVQSKGPADQAGLRVGDEIVAIDGKALKGGADVDRLLAGTVGKEVRVRFRPISEEGLGDVREELVKPIAFGALQGMRMQQWVQGNGERVQEESKGRIGYIHLSAMNPENLAKFQRAVSNWNRRSRVKGMIIDIRENGGGNIHQQLMEILTARPYAKVSMRGSPLVMTQPALYWDKPVVVLINERSFSDAEVFPYIFQVMKVGKVIGVPTPGGVIGTNDITLSDGTQFRIPRTRYEGLDGTNLEHYGVKPDILVEHSAEDRLAGRDMQLAKAIEVVMGEIKSAGATTKPDKPTEQPESGRTEPTPTEPRPETPEDGAAAVKADAMNPLSDAKVGEWVRYVAELPGSPEQTTMKVRLVEIEDGEISFERELESGPPVPLPLPRAVQQGPLLEVLRELGAVKSHEVRKMEIDGQEAEVAVVTLEAFGGTLRMLFSNHIPCMGLWKVELGKMTLLTAQAWGADEPEPTPAAEAAKPEAPKPASPEPETPKTETPKPEPKPEPATPKGDAEAGDGEGEEVQGPPNPLRDAKVGEWVRLRSVVQGEETVATLRVVAVEDETVKLESRIAYGETEIKGATITRPRRDTVTLARGRGKVEIGRETLEVKGRKIECVTITRTMRRGGVDKRWISDEIPVTGLVRQERDGKVVKELLDWGTDAGAPAPGPSSQGG